MPKTDFMWPNVPAYNSALGIDIVVMLTNQLECVIRRPCCDAEPNWTTALRAFNPEGNQWWAMAGHVRPHRNIEARSRILSNQRLQLLQYDLREQ